MKKRKDKRKVLNLILVLLLVVSNLVYTTPAVYAEEETAEITVQEETEEEATSEKSEEAPEEKSDENSEEEPEEEQVEATEEKEQPDENSEEQSDEDESLIEDTDTEEKEEDTSISSEEEGMAQELTEEITEEPEHEYEYQSNEDGTHKVICKNCDFEETESCDYEKKEILDEEGNVIDIQYTCKKCGYSKEEDDEEPLSFKVSFYGKDSTSSEEILLDEQQVEKGEAAKAPEVPEVKGYNFKKWDKSFEVIEDDLEVHAEYEYALSERTLKRTVDGRDIVAIGNLPINAELKVYKVNSLSKYENIVNEELSSDKEFIASIAYDIKIMVDAEEWQPCEYGETIQIKINNTELDLFKDVEVYRITSEKEVTNLSSEIKSDEVKFETDHFTVYVIGTSGANNIKTGDTVSSSGSGLVSWTVPKTGYYQITVAGAKGGDGLADALYGSSYLGREWSAPGANGEVSIVKVKLVQGTVLQIYKGAIGGGCTCIYNPDSRYYHTIRSGVGGWPDGQNGTTQQGTSSGTTAAAGGGGGGGSSYVVANGVTLLQARGGNGGNSYISYANGNGNCNGTGGTGGGSTRTTNNAYYEPVRVSTSSQNGGEGYVSIYLIKQIPEITLSSNTEWVNEKVTITAQVINEGEGLPEDYLEWSTSPGEWASNTQIEVTKNGTYTCKIKDNTGNETTKSYIVSNIDYLPPTLEITENTTEWTNEAVVLTATAEDANATTESGKSGVAAYKWESGEWGTETTYEVTQNGTYTCTIKDQAGNETTESFEVTNIDCLSPVLEITENTTEWTNGSVVLTATAEDATATSVSGQTGVAAYKWESEEWGTENTYTVTKNGTYTCKVKDQVGNETTESFEVTNIDTLAPSLEIAEDPTEWTNEAVVLTATAEDIEATTESGKSEIETYKWESEEWGEETTYTVTQNGTYTCKVKDNAGNETTKEFVVLNIDTLAPTLEIEENITEWTIDDIELIATAEDEDETLENGKSDIDAYSWEQMNVMEETGDLDSLGNPIYHIVKKDKWVPENTYTVTKNGTYTCKVKDHAGNITEKEFTVSNIDRVPPKVTAVRQNKWYSGTTLIIWQATDYGDNEAPGCGLDEKPYSLDGITYVETCTQLISAEGIYSIYVKDKLGNIGYYEVELLYDKVPYSKSRRTVLTIANVVEPIIPDIIQTITDIADNDILNPIIKEVPTIKKQKPASKSEETPEDGTCEITLRDADGKVINKNVYVKGARIVIPSITPKALDKKYVYVFDRWEPEVPLTASTDGIYTAVYRKVLQEYEIVFTDGENIISQKMYHYEDKVQEPKAPEKEGYKFIGWSKELEPLCLGNAVYVAQYELINKETAEENMFKLPVVIIITTVIIVSFLLALILLLLLYKKKKERERTSN